MSVPEVITFQQAIARTQGQDRTLLIGNGFSAQYFSYANLLTESGLEAGGAIRNLFDNLGTVDFEAVVRSLEDAVIVERSYGNNEHAGELEADAQRVREALVQAVRTTHPEHRENPTLNYGNPATFLRQFEKVFTLNYDLLLYWVILEQGRLRDGFGLGETSLNGRFRGPFREDAYCSVFNIHGGLHLFQNSVGDVEKALNGGDGVVATIANEITIRRRLPIYVAEGTWQSKLKKINSIGYLRHCLQALRQNMATVFIYGHSAADNDTHIYDAIFRSEAGHVYFGVYEPTEEKTRRLDGELSRYSLIAGNRVQYTLYDSGTANVWGAREVGAQE
jgi:hypothetical protein